MNEDYYHEQNSCYDSNSFGFDQVQPPQYTVNHPIFNSQNELLNSQNKLMEQMATLREMVDQAIQKKEEEKRIAEEQAARDRSWKIPICYDDDEDNIINNHISLDILREKLSNVNLLIAKIDALRDNPTPSSEVMIKSTSTFPNLFLEEANTFDNSIPESETFRFNLEEIGSGSPITHSELSLPDFKAFYIDNDHFKERSSGSTTTLFDFSHYDSFIFDLSNDQFPQPIGVTYSMRSSADELAQIISSTGERITKKRTKNKAKTTKLDSEWKSCEGQSQSKAKDQKSQSQSQLNKLTVKTGAVIEEYYWLQSQPI
ncbi:hypothetical protein Tco_1284091 [Tanacetum coccineum]